MQLRTRFLNNHQVSVQYLLHRISELFHVVCVLDDLCSAEHMNQEAKISCDERDDQAALVLKTPAEHHKAMHGQTLHQVLVNEDLARCRIGSKLQAIDDAKIHQLWEWTALLLATIRQLEACCTVVQGLRTEYLMVSRLDPEVGIHLTVSVSAYIQNQPGQEGQSNHLKQLQI